VIFGFKESSKKYEYNEATALSFIDKSGYKDTDDDGFREKIIEKTKKIGKQTLKEEEKIPLEITLTIPNTPETELIGTMLKEQWKKLGVKTNLEILESYEIQQDKINPREYDAILFGEILGMIPDPFSFWHSSQKKYPGLNLSLFGNRDADKLLEEARQSLDENTRTKKYEEFQNLILSDYSTLFLYSPPFLYTIDKKIKGMDAKMIADPSKRFTNISDWYINTKRAHK
jgi:peptide/nickel transport system substrate-binding protein